MSTLNFDEKTARALLQTVRTVKSRGVSRIYYPAAPFCFAGDEFRESDALVLTPDGEVKVVSSDLVDLLFEPVAKRNSKAVTK